MYNLVPESFDDSPVEEVAIIMQNKIKRIRFFLFTLYNLIVRKTEESKFDRLIYHLKDMLNIL